MYGVQNEIEHTQNLWFHWISKCLHLNGQRFALIFDHHFKLTPCNNHNFQYYIECVIRSFSIMRSARTPIKRRAKRTHSKCYAALKAKSNSFLWLRLKFLIRMICMKQDLSSVFMRLMYNYKFPELAFYEFENCTTWSRKNRHQVESIRLRFMALVLLWPRALSMSMKYIQISISIAILFAHL